MNLRIESLNKQIAGLQAERDRLRAGVAAIDALISNSHGVAGLHLNGDIAPWDELLSGGRFEEWLRDFDTARAALGDRHE